MTNNNKKGFTLVELLVVIALIGVLAAIALVVIDPVMLQKRAKDGVIKAQLDKVGLAASGVASTDDNQFYPTCIILAGSLTNDLTGPSQSCTSAVTPPANQISMSVGAAGTVAIAYGGYGTIKGCLSTPSLVDPTKFIQWCSTTGTVTSTSATACTAAGC